MTDRELLELAAKAVGYAVCEPFRDGEFRVCGHDRLSFVWNPLDDDGDALRLAVALGIHIIPTVGATATFGWRNARERDDDNGGDEYAAARRAIVRAAAAIGEDM